MESALFIFLRNLLTTLYLLHAQIVDKEWLLTAIESALIDIAVAPFTCRGGPNDDGLPASTSRLCSCQQLFLGRCRIISRASALDSTV
jgi:hypothetical protein